MKIAFASCLAADADSVQNVWTGISSTSPDAFLFVGDNVYMDFGLFGHNRIGWPRKVSDQEFADALYERYQKQWNVALFRNFLGARKPKLGLTWDDHDFAWNDSRGAGTQAKYAVPQNKRLISRYLFDQFRTALRTGAVAYPSMPAMGTMLAAPAGGIQEYFDHQGVRIIMLDGRSFREDPNVTPDAEMHGRAQREWLTGCLQAAPGLCVVCSGSVMSHSKESWDQYVDYAWLLAEADRLQRRVIVLTGDVHKNIPPTRHSGKVIEITSSGAARPGLGGASGNYGLLTIDGQTVKATLFSDTYPGGSDFQVVFQ